MDQEFIEHKGLLQRHMDLADFTITDAERILQLDHDLDEVDLLVRQLRDHIGDIENIGAEVLKMPAAVRAPLEEIRMIRQNYKQKTTQLKNILKYLVSVQNQSQVPQGKPTSALSHDKDATVQQTPNTPTIENDISKLPNPPNTDVLATSSVVSTKPDQPSSQVDGDRQTTDMTAQAKRQADDPLVAILERLTNKDDHSSMRLPKVFLAPFNGEVADWQRFDSAFTTEVDNNQKLHFASKYNYLTSLLKGKAKEAVVGLPYTEAGYEECKRILKERYGRPSHLKRQTIRELETLEPIGWSYKLERVHKFTEKFTKAVRTLKTIDALNDAEGAIFKIFDKLGYIRESVINRDDNWEQWKLENLADQLEKYCQRNPLNEERFKNTDKAKDYRSRNSDKSRTWENTRSDTKQRDKAYMTKGKKGPAKIEPTCVYCKGRHYSDRCGEVTTAVERKRFLYEHKLCYNCCSSKHLLNSFTSSRNCFHCKEKHHSSICPKAVKTIKEGSSDETAKADEKNFATSTTKKSSIQV